MKIEKLEKGKETWNKIVNLKGKIIDIQNCLKEDRVQCKIGYKVGTFGKIRYLTYDNSDAIKAMIKKDLEPLEKELRELEKQFEEL